MGRLQDGAVLRNRERSGSHRSESLLRLMMRCAALLAAFFAISISSAAADERITDYASDIAVARTGMLTVTERISVVSEGINIRHGIFRDFPTAYKGRLGRPVHAGCSARRAPP